MSNTPSPIPSPESCAFALSVWNQEHGATTAALMMASAAGPQVSIACVGSVCVGVNATGIACAKRTVFDTGRHSRGYCCTTHGQDNMKCHTCDALLHAGCFVIIRGEILVPTQPWKCTKCAELAVSETVTTTVSVTPPGEIECTPKVVVVYGNEASLHKSATKHGWNFACRGGNNIYLRCKRIGCLERHTAKGKDEAFHVTASPGQFPHNKCYPVLKDESSMVDGYIDRVSTLDKDLFKLIQQLACTRVFSSHLIAKHLHLSHHNVLVDTTLIFNIGYRCRSKMFGNRSDTFYLTEQQQVYTTSSFISICLYFIDLHRPDEKWVIHTSLRSPQKGLSSAVLLFIVHCCRCGPLTTLAQEHCMGFILHAPARELLRLFYVRRDARHLKIWLEVSSNHMHP